MSNFSAQQPYRTYLSRDFFPLQAHLIFINPYSGNKKSMKIFQETLEPLLKERRIFYEVRVTQKPKEVEEFFQTSTAISLREKYSAIVILSGDGLLFEAIQGLYKRTISPEEESPKNHKVRNIKHYLSPDRLL